VSGDFETGFFVGEDERRAHPMRSAQGGAGRALPARFYQSASIRREDDGFRVLLDGRPVRTPAARPLSLPTEAAAVMVAAEWAAQGPRIHPATMHATRIAHSAIDHVAGAMEAVLDDALRYAESDLVCYRAAEPERVVLRQRRLWDPLVAHVEARLGVRLALAEGVVYVAQPADTGDRFRAVLSGQNPLERAAFHVMTTLAGSIVIALAVTDGAIAARDGFSASEVDADVNAEIWGEDAEALARRAFREAEFVAAAGLFAAARPATPEPR
jgi:chaperone required for assembly of F1-ATPase